MSVQVAISEGSPWMPLGDVHPLCLTASSPEVKFYHLSQQPSKTEPLLTCSSPTAAPHGVSHGHLWPLQKGHIPLQGPCSFLTGPSQTCQLWYQLLGFGFIVLMGMTRKGEEEDGFCFNLFFSVFPTQFLMTLRLAEQGVTEERLSIMRGSCSCC